MLSSISSNSLKYISSKYSDSYQDKQAFSSVHANSLVHSSTENSHARQDNHVLSSVYSNSLKRISSKYSDSYQDKQVFSGVASNSLFHFSSKDSHQDNQVLSSVYSNSLGCNSSKYLDSHQDKQGFFCATVNSTKYNFVKRLDSYQKASSNFSYFIDIENPYYENDCTPPDSDDDDYILGINVDPYIQEDRIPPEIEDSEYDVNFYSEENEYRFNSKYVDCNETNDSLLNGDWQINTNYDDDPNYEENDSLPADDWNFKDDANRNNEENESLPADDWNFKYDANRNNGENNSCPTDDWYFNSNHADDSNYEERNLSPGDDWALSSNYDPHNEENDSTSDNGYIFSFKYKANPNYKKCDSFSEIDTEFDSNHDADQNYEQNDSSLGEDWDSNSNYDDFNEEYGTASDVDEWFNSKCNVDPYEKEYDSPPEEDFEFISNHEVNSYYKENKSLDLKNEHAFLLQFYKTLVDELMEKLSIGYLDIRASLQYMISNHRGVVKGQLPSENDYCNTSYCLGYLHRYAACHSVLISDSVSTILNSSSSNVLNTKLSREQLNIMFLGGGPGNDFVGFLTALHSYREHLQNLDVTVVDKMSGWEDVFNETIQKLKKSGYGKVYHIFDDVAITTSFFSADLKNGDEWNTDMRNKLQRADIIFLVKVLSHIPNHEKLGVLENIILYMKPGALIIYADSPYPNREFAAVARQLRPVYKSKKKNFAMKAKTFKFGYHNITRCTAQVRIFERW